MTNVPPVLNADDHRLFAESLGLTLEIDDRVDRSSTPPLPAHVEVPPLPPLAVEVPPVPPVTLPDLPSVPPVPGLPKLP